MRLAIYGAGSLGTVLGAYLSKDGIAVDLISRNQAHIKALQENGATIKGSISMQVPVSALLPEQMTGTYDCIILLTKQLENEKVATFLRPFLAEKGLLCTMQNGLPEPLLQEILTEERVCGCTIGWGATLLEPGVAQLTSNTDALTFNLGMGSDKQNPLLSSLAEVLSHMGNVTIEENFVGTRYAKLLINAAFSGLGTVLGCTFGEVAGNKKARLLAQRIMKECLDTAKASHIVLEKVQGKDIAKLFDYHSALKRWFSYQLIPLALKKHRSIKPSMLQDIEKGKPCEVDAINGVLSEQAHSKGVKTPVNDRVVAIIHEIEKGNLKSGWENLQLFEKRIESF